MAPPPNGPGNTTAPTSLPVPTPPQPLDKPIKKSNPADKYTLRVIDRLGLPASRWNKVKVKVLQEYGHLIDVKLASKICLVGGEASIEKLERAQAWAADLLTQNGKDAPTLQMKIAAANIVALCSKEIMEASKRVIEFAEKSADVAQNARPKNLPPTVAVQLNVAGASSPAAPATPANNGNHTQEVLTVEEETPASAV